MPVAVTVCAHGVVRQPLGLAQRLDGFVGGLETGSVGNDLHLAAVVHAALAVLVVAHDQNMMPQTLATRPLTLIASGPVSGAKTSHPTR